MKLVLNPGSTIDVVVLGGGGGGGTGEKGLVAGGTAGGTDAATGKGP